MRAKDLSGQKFGKLTVQKFSHRDKHSHTMWVCLCECGKESVVESSRLTHGITKTCGCSRSTKNNKHPLFTGYKEIGGKFWYDIQKGARSRKIEFKLTIQEIWRLFLKQNRRCSLTGLEIEFADSNSKDRRGQRTASLDRIDSSKGYIIDNIQWVHKDVNRMKNIYTQNRFIEICCLVANNRR